MLASKLAQVAVVGTMCIQLCAARVQRVRWHVSSTDMPWEQTVGFRVPSAPCPTGLHVAGKPRAAALLDPAP